MKDEIPKFTLPEAFASCLAAFDVEGKAFDGMGVFTALQGASKDVGDDLTAGEKAACNAEITAFSLIPNARKSPWKSYFGPLASGERADGSAFYSPDIAYATAGTLEYWEERAANVKNPILQARYADLVWDLGAAMGRARKSPEMGRLAAVAYLSAVSVHQELHHKLESAARALELGIKLRDEAHVTAAREAMLELHTDAINKRVRWLFVFDRLINNKKAGLSDAQVQKLVDDLEGLLEHFSDHAPEKFNPHDVKAIVERLIPYYERQKRPDEVKRLRGAVGRAFERFGSMGDGLLGSLVLGDAVAAYAAAGMEGEAQNARLLLEKKAAEAKEQMVPIGSQIEIPKEDMDKYLAAMVVDDLGETLVNIAMELLARRDVLEKQVEETAKHAPLMAMTGRSILADNRVTAKIGSTKDDPFGRLLQQALQHFQFAGIWLHCALSATIKRHAVTADSLVAWAQRAGLFTDPTLLREGLKAWLDADYVKAMHVLVPQVEQGLRDIVGKLGKPVTKAYKPVPGVSVAKSMGDILFDEEVTKALGPDITVHLQALYTDPRGWNIRNEIAHGLLGAEHMNQGTTQWIVHTILLFGLWGELSESNGVAQPANQ